MGRWHRQKKQHVTELRLNATEPFIYPNINQFSLRTVNGIWHTEWFFWGNTREKQEYKEK
ncbi:Uncharacterised protein [Yersinia pseudotuberculosis]|nr:Uncharacterised protein [Yersinia pseudotuberculosis]SUP88759.1 Uncharacterised protein [Yersinia pseudotuberculosis]